MRICARTAFGAVIAGLCAMALQTGSARSDSVADFYRGRTVTIAVPSSAGGTFHLYALLVQRFIGRHLPGTPTVIVQNRPGAGGITMNNYMMHAAPRDGTMIAEINPGTVTVPLFRSVRYDPREFLWLGSVVVRTYVGAVWHTSPATTIDQMKTTEVLMGSVGTNGLSYQLPRLMNDVLGTRYRMITGYKGGGEINHAIERGEIHGRVTFHSAFTAPHPHWIRDGKLKFFFVLGPVEPGLESVQRLKDAITDADGRQMLTLIEAGLEVGQAFFAPPGVPADRAAALRDAFSRAINDPEFRDEAKRQDLEVTPRSPADIEQVIAASFRTPPELVRRYAKILGLDAPEAPTPPQ